MPIDDKIKDLIHESAKDKELMAIYNSLSGENVKNKRHRRTKKEMQGVLVGGKNDDRK